MAAEAGRGASTDGYVANDHMVCALIRRDAHAAIAVRCVLRPECSVPGMRYQRGQAQVSASTAHKVDALRAQCEVSSVEE